MCSFCEHVQNGLPVVFITCSDANKCVCVWSWNVLSLCASNVHHPNLPVEIQCCTKIYYSIHEMLTNADQVNSSRTQLSLIHDPVNWISIAFFNFEEKIDIIKFLE